MKGKNSTSSKDTESRILQAATKLFLKRGYHGTSIDDITKAVKLTKGTFYWYFKSKEGIMLNILQEFDKLFLDGLIKAFDDVNGGALAKLEKYVRYSAAFAYYNPELSVLFTTISGELVGTRQKIEKEIRRIYEKYKKVLAEIMIQGIKEGVVKKDLDPILAASVSIAFHGGILLQWYMNKGRIDEKANVETFKRIMLTGVLVEHLAPASGLLPEGRKKEG